MNTPSLRPRYPRALAIAGLLLALGGFSLAGCSSNGDDVIGGAGATPAEISAEAGTDQWRTQVLDRTEAQWAVLVDGAIAEALEAHPLQPLLLGGDPPLRLRRQLFLGHLYETRDWQPVFFGATGVTPSGQRVLATIAGARDHGMNSESFLPAASFEHVEQAQQWAHVWQQLPPLEMSAEDHQALEAHLDDVRESDDPAAALAAVMLGAESAEASPTPALWQAFHDRQEFAVALNGAAAMAESAIADAALAYAYDMRHFNEFYLDMAEAPDDERQSAIAERMTSTFEALAECETGDEAQAELDALPPQHPYYVGLVAERARYQGIVEAGGWETISERRLRLGSENSAVSELKRRLQIEEYYEGDPLGMTFDATLDDAVKAYQRTHQMEVDGVCGPDFWSSLNIPAERRLQQIDITLDRWRENRIGNDTKYLWVNIPDMHAEGWSEGERGIRFRIVVGNTRRECDPRTNRLRLVNATPIQTANMSYVVLNPTWNVPLRIAREELLPELLEDPLYFEHNGFERLVRDNGYEYIRQQPGPNNPLGRVKFIFPNPHSTYMHDTNRPQYFQYPIRAFSHGCMRVSEPMALLEYVLTQDGQWDERKVDRIFERGREESITLEDHIPVHMEYYVVSIDDDGRANFLADIYRYDRDRITPPSVASLRCVPEDAPTESVVFGEDGELLIEDIEGNRFTREEWDAIQNGEGSGDVPFDAPTDLTRDAAAAPADSAPVGTTPVDVVAPVATPAAVAVPIQALPIEAVPAEVAPALEEPTPAEETAAE
ncbi:MAG: murein L,D-transpeptidase YcbB/YkuD [Bradymonadia bacterium]|jgi:murein L,D-transpeptidase YcbB/YkuD